MNQKSRNWGRAVGLFSAFLSAISIVKQREQNLPFLQPKTWLKKKMEMLWSANPASNYGWTTWWITSFLCQLFPSGIVAAFVAIKSNFLLTMIVPVVHHSSPLAFALHCSIHSDLRFWPKSTTELCSSLVRPAQAVTDRQTDGETGTRELMNGYWEFKWDHNFLSNILSSSPIKANTALRNTAWIIPPPYDYGQFCWQKIYLTLLH